MNLGCASAIFISRACRTGSCWPPPPPPPEGVERRLKLRHVYLLSFGTVHYLSRGCVSGRDMFNKGRTNELIQNSRDAHVQQNVMTNRNKPEV
jgi:hypothetical protein